MITMMKIMLKIKVIIKNYQKKQKGNTITVNKTLITDKTLAGEERKKYLLHPNYKKTTLSNMQCKHFP